MQRPSAIAAFVASSVVTACTTGATPAASQTVPAAADPAASTVVRDAIDAMGGEARLRAIHSIHLSIMASGAQIEGADRPEAPWQINHYLLDDWLDYEHGAWRKDVQSMVVDGGDGQWRKVSVLAADGGAAGAFDSNGAG